MPRCTVMAAGRWMNVAPPGVLQAWGGPLAICGRRFSRGKQGRVLGILVGAACAVTACQSGSAGHALAASAMTSDGRVTSDGPVTPGGGPSVEATRSRGRNPSVPPAASVPAFRVGRFTLDVPGAGTVTYKLIAPSCGARADVASLPGGGRIRLAGSTLTVVIPGLATRVVAVGVTHRDAHTRAGGTAVDGSAVSVVFEC